ncbi:Aspartate beta-hydroxylase domain-containing protein 2 [Durusdinium trenchii]|uniref:Aspartate beta-hydroxylase domain-containing protein 2 n=1 Tax=Durusdinium trenchii TaxID=1381693 RepID=A0ABP0K7M2_9DINO
MVFDSMFHHGQWEDHPITDVAPVRHWNLRHSHTQDAGHAVHAPDVITPIRPRHLRGQEGPWFLAPKGTPEATLVKLRPLKDFFAVFGTSAARKITGGHNAWVQMLFRDRRRAARKTPNKAQGTRMSKRLAHDYSTCNCRCCGILARLSSFLLCAGTWEEVRSAAVPLLEAAFTRLLERALSFQEAHPPEREEGGPSSKGCGSETGETEKQEQYMDEDTRKKREPLVDVGAAFAKRRQNLSKAAALLQRGNDLFEELQQYPFFSFRKWENLYDINTNSHVFPEGFRQRPVWPNSAVPLAGWLEENYQTFREDLDLILNRSLFDTLYFMGHVSMTQFSGRRESWAPLNLIHNRELAPHACEVANRSCDLLRSRPEIARCHAKDVGAAFARLQPGMGIKPHLWNAPPRLAAHLGLRTPHGASMAVGEHHLSWDEGQALVFDDTYIHSVNHEGTDDRYLLVTWFCHPCDTLHAEELPECALGPHSLRHTISYSNLNGQEQIQETEVTCSGDDCETTTSNVLPQIIRVREPKAKRMCSGSPGLIWDGLDTVVHRVTNSARRVLGYAPVETEKTPHENLQPLALRSEGVMKMYTYSNNNGQEEMKEVQSHCKDGTCVQRSRIFAPSSVKEHLQHDAKEIRPQAAQAYQA